MPKGLAFLALAFATVFAGLAAGGLRAATAADTTPPETRIVRGPGHTVWVPRARFRFAASERGVRFSCRLDGEAWRRCRSPVTLRGLEVGWHRFRVRALDAAGNRDPSPAVRRFRFQPRIG